MVELETDLPLAKNDRTQKPRQKSGEKFMVPQGTKLLSQGVKVTSSDEDPIYGNLDMITDGNKETPNRETPEGEYYVELGDGLQWVQLDLGKPHALYAILVWHYYLPRDQDYLSVAEPPFLARMYKDVIVQISNDPVFKQGVVTVFNNDHDNSTGLGKGKDATYIETSEGRWINPKGVEGRYVRLYSRGYNCLWNGSEDPKDNPYNHHAPPNPDKLRITFNDYIEVDVYGK